MTPLLSAFYFGSVEHYRLLARHAVITIDIGEHYERQSYRTRTHIVGPNGQQDLNVQITRDHGNKMPMRDVGLSYVERWPQQHLHAIRSAYGQTPWFIHYVDDIEHVLMQRYDRLVDLDLATARLGLKWLGLTTELVVAEQYVEDTSTHLDLRRSLHPKRPLPAGVEAVPSYHQVFADRHGYVPRQSIVDLVCNCGPQAALVLRR